MSAEQDFDRRLSSLEARLERIEQALSKSASSRSEIPEVSSPPEKTPPASDTIKIKVPGQRTQKPAQDRSWIITSVLGWGGAMALVLAAAYLIRLAIDSGWLNPARQVFLATIGGLALIGTGLMLRQKHEGYASLLPGGGIVVLFLATYGAHLYYELIGSGAAILAVVFVSLLSLWLCRVFHSDLFSLFAIIGSYSAPLLLGGTDASIFAIALYFVAWNVIFCVFAVWHGKRSIYLLAVYLAFIVFDLAWKDVAPSQWGEALTFQAIQFAIFGAAAVVFSIRRKDPMSIEMSLVHLPAILIFYALQYAVLNQYLPMWAPWIAIASVVLVASLYLIAQSVMIGPLEGGALLLWSYVALVFVHAVYIELIPVAWQPWVALILAALYPAVSFIRLELENIGWPAWVAVGLLFLANYVQLVTQQEMERFLLPVLLPVAYAVFLYAAYESVRKNPDFRSLKVVVLYPAHLMAMAAAVYAIPEPILESAVWGVLAVACLFYARMSEDRQLAQSALLLFALTAGKVLLFDLAGAAPIARILSLVVLGISFYLGGILYQRSFGPQPTTNE